MNHSFQKFNAYPKLTMKFGSAGNSDGQFSYPEAVTVDSSGNIYVADTENDRVQKFNPAGNLLARWTYGVAVGQQFKPRGVVVDGSLVYVSDSCGDRIVKSGLDGSSPGEAARQTGN